MKKIIGFIISIAALNAQAASVYLNEVPTNWRLENYTGGQVVMWYTPSSCINGQITFPSTATADDKNRLWSTIITAKTNQKKIFVFYNNATSNCQIVSFGMQN